MKYNAMATQAMIGKRTWTIVTTLASTPDRFVSLLRETRADGRIVATTNRPTAIPTILDRSSILSPPLTYIEIR